MAEPNSTSKPPPPANIYTFLNSSTHNAQQSEQDSAVKYDRFAHTRTKRKRTSPQDFAVLEAAYQINAKPDRATRTSLANRVALTEKEVQVWFQNRRQMTRKKRGTWQPNEITSIIRSSQDPNKSGSSVSPNSSFGGTSRSEESSQHDQNDISAPQSSFGGTDTNDHEYITRSSSSNVSQGESQESQESSPYLQTIPSSAEESHQTRTELKQAGTTGELKRTSSIVRLAMSLDGKASVIRCGETPSPPNKTVFTNPLARMSLQRSKSLIAPTTSSNSSIILPPLPKVSRVPGRSRDTRNWEFWCDSERRESLTISAEIDLRGSAAGPISLLRSGSSNKGGSINRKRKSDEALNERRPKLSRTKSSGARLQSSPDNATKMDDPKKKAGTIHIDGSDSDKENVDPDPTTIPAPRANATPRVLGNKRQILRENTNVPSLSTSLGVLLEREKQNTPAKTPGKRGPKLAAAAVVDKENIEIDSEVASFMKPCSTRREEDMDAVQNLLRLSQGAWQ